jgi:hypothetical protein
MTAENGGARVLHAFEWAGLDGVIKTLGDFQSKIKDALAFQPPIGVSPRNVTPDSPVDWHRNKRLKFMG